jgi:hypothetical protein
MQAPADPAKVLRRRHGDRGSLPKFCGADTGTAASWQGSAGSWQGSAGSWQGSAGSCTRAAGDTAAGVGVAVGLERGRGSSF